MKYVTHLSFAASEKYAICVKYTTCIIYVTLAYSNQHFVEYVTRVLYMTVCVPYSTVLLTTMTGFYPHIYVHLPSFSIWSGITRMDMPNLICLKSFAFKNIQTPQFFW